MLSSGLVFWILYFVVFRLRKKPEAEAQISEAEKSEFLIENEKLLESIFENAPVTMVLLNQKTELVKINKAGKTLGIHKNENLKNLGIGDAFGCITAVYKTQGCGNGKECSRCSLRLTVKNTLEKKTILTKVPILMMIQKDDDEVPFNFLLSSSFLEIGNTPMALIVLEDITTIVKAERALIESEFRYKQITRAITDYIYTVIVDENSDIQTIHTVACFKITGYQAEEFEINPTLWFDIIHENDRIPVMDFIKNAGGIREKNVIEYRIIKKDGTTCWVSNTLVSKAYGKYRNMRYDGILRDITERKSAEELLENQNRLFNTMLDTLPIGIFMIDATDGKPLIANSHAKELMGKGVEADAGFSNLNRVYNAYRAGTNEFYPLEEMPVYRGLKGEKSHIDDMEILHPNGSRVLLEVVGCPVYDNNNKIYASLVGFYNITDRKNAEIALRESEEKLSIIFEYSQFGIALSDDFGYIQYMNPAFCKLLGCSSEYVVGKNFRIFTDPADVDIEISRFQALRSRQSNMLNFEKKYIRKDGTEIWVQLLVSCFIDSKEKGTKFIAMAEDITEQKKSLDMLKASEEKFRNIFNTSNDGILITDLSGNILEVNKITEERSGYPLETLQKFNILDLISVNDKDAAIYQLKNIKDRIGFLQSSYINSRGEKIYIEIVGHTIKYDDRDAILMISRDISERMAMQQKILNAIIEAEEKERTFFSQELHDGIGPILSTVKLYLQWIQNPETRSDKAVLLENALDTIEEAIDSVKEISNKLSPNVLKKFGLDTAIQSFVRKLYNINQVKFSIHIQLPERIRPEIETMLYRVLVEAINNSLKYAEASHISVDVTINSELLQATFRDNGKGFEVNTLENSSGHGLFNMHNRVKTCEGTFVIRSNPGAGTEINISIPVDKVFNYSAHSLNP